MKIKELKDLIKELPEEMEILFSMSISNWRFPFLRVVSNEINEVVNDRNRVIISLNGDCNNDFELDDDENKRNFCL